MFKINRVWSKRSATRMKVVHSKPRIQRDQPPFPGYRLFLLLFLLIAAAIGYHIWAGPEYPVVIGPDGEEDIAPDRKRKLERELEEIDNAEQYALIVVIDGYYPCFTCPNGANSIFLYASEVWRYGITRKGERLRYPRGDFGTEDVRYVLQFTGNFAECLKQEKLKIYNYPLLPEAQKRKIKLLRPPGNKNDS